MPSEISSRTPFKPVRFVLILAAVFGGLGYLLGSGAFSGSAATNKPSMYTTTIGTTTTTPQR